MELTEEAVTAQVVKDDGSYFGPKAPLNPAFAEKTSTLLGVSDFFRAFSVTFEADREPPEFYLAY